jgi:hypothetical protein
MKASKLQAKPSVLKREHPALSNTKFHNFFFFVQLCSPGSGSSRAERNQCGSMRIRIHNTELRWQIYLFMTAWPILPRPTIPTVDPRSEGPHIHSGDQAGHAPLCNNKHCANPRSYFYFFHKNQLLRKSLYFQFCKEHPQGRPGGPRSTL